MTYCKKVAVLKQYAEGFSSVKALSGIVRIETESEIGTIFISIINATHVSVGEYVCYVADSVGNLHKFTLGKRPSSLTKNFPVCPNVANGFSAGLFYVENNLPLLVAFCKTEDFQGNMQTLKKSVNERCLQDFKVVADKPDIQTSKPEETKRNKSITEIYNDEAVATENYFGIDDCINEKISILENWQDEILQNENGGTIHRSQTQKEQNQERLNCFENETNVNFSQKYTNSNPYYNQVKEELKVLFEKFPQENALLGIFPNGKWVKIFYSEDKYYVVGLITECDKPKYICYGIPHPYSEQPPKELEGVSTFIPLSLFDLRGDGYWMMFQDAVTGKCVKMKSVKNMPGN